MRKLILSALAAGAVGLLPNPTPADAQDTSLLECTKEAIASCDEDFKGDSIYMAAARGYCYMIRTGICKIYKPQ